MYTVLVPLVLVSGVTFTPGIPGTILHLLEIALDGVAPIADWDPMATTAAAWLPYHWQGEWHLLGSTQ
jgi:hypothetical protein